MNRDFVEMLSALSDQEVEYLVVGAHALAYHARPRATGDLDLWVRPTAGNARRILRALEAFGAPLADVTASDFEAPEHVLELGVAPNRIDLLTGITGVDFEGAWTRRQDTTIEGVRVAILGREDLIRNKQATGRPQDLADLATLRESQ